VHKFDGRRQRLLAGGGALLLCMAVGVAFATEQERRGASGNAVAGEARQGSMTLALPPALQNVEVTEARLRGD
jgi:hypothetical protein